MTNGNKPLDKIVSDLNDKITSIAEAKGIIIANNNNNNDNDDREERLKFGKTAILYGDPDESRYATEMEKNTRKYYMTWYKSIENQIRHNVMNAKDLADKDKTEAFVSEVMSDFVNYCKTVYLEYEQHQRDTHKTVISYKDIKYINTETGEVEGRWDLYMNEFPI